MRNALWGQSSTDTGQVCHGCGAALTPMLAPGRAKKWCSQRCRKRTLYAGACIDCGAPTNGYNGPERASERCSPCRHRFERENARWTRETCLDAIREFERRYGRPPTAVDFNPQHARVRGQYDRAERFYADDCYPTLHTVQRVWGTWGAALTAAGCPPNKTGRPRKVAA